MPGTLLLVHIGHKTCAAQRIEQDLRIDIVGRKGEIAVLTGYPRFDCIVLAPGQIDYYSNSATFT